jgi:hypothetical protein
MPFVGEIRANAQETFFFGRWCPTETVVTDLPINDISFRTLHRFAFGLHFVCEMCARPEGLLGNSVGLWVDQRSEQPETTSERRRFEDLGPRPEPSARFRPRNRHDLRSDQNPIWTRVGQARLLGV